MFICNKSKLLGASLALSSVLLSSCTPLSKEGPNASDIKSSASSRLGGKDNKTLTDYVLVKLDSKILPFFGRPEPTSLYGTFGDKKSAPSSIILGVGDVVQVTIFEAQTGGLFIPEDAGARPGNYVTLPAQQIEGTGMLQIPYAGPVRFSGRSIAEVQADIAKQLANRAIEPQVVISLLSQQSSQVSVVGEVRTPARVDINPAGDRVVDVIARAGGPSYPGYETYVTLERGKRTSTVNFEDILTRPRENIYIHKNDTVYLYREAAKYIAFGATGSNFSADGKLIDFGARDLSLAEAIAKVGGINDDRADARRVFLYRLLERKQLLNAGMDLKAFPLNQELIPTVFQLSLQDPGAYFAAQNFFMANKDILYVDNSGAYELSKFLNIVSQSSQTVTSVNQSVISTKNAKDAIKNW